MLSHFEKSPLIQSIKNLNPKYDTYILPTYLPFGTLFFWEFYAYILFLIKKNYVSSFFNHIFVLIIVFENINMLRFLNHRQPMLLNKTLKVRKFT